MKIFFDLLPVALFFAAYKVAGIFIATAVAIATTILQIAWVWWRHRKVDTLQWVSLGIIVVFGGATLLLHDESYIKLKPTVLYWLISLGLLVSLHGFHKNPMRAMLGAQFSLPEPVWVHLNTAWAGFFALMGVLNLYVARNFSTDEWVNFKLFGFTGLMLVFVVAQALLLGRYVEDNVVEKL
ncbi:MAG: septation protein A [Georgfuchsia sp.]